MALIDHFMPPMAFAAMLASEENLATTSFETARADMDRLLDQAVAKARLEKPGQADDALFAVCAFADEAILDSTWPGREAWMRRKLQETRFQTANAGLEFYERLELLCADCTPEAAGAVAANEPATAPDDGEQRELLEVYVACLTLGFRGKYNDAQGQAQVDRLAGANLRRLLADSGLPDEKIFPEAYADALQATKTSAFTPVVKAVLFFGLPLLLAVGIYAAYASLLSAFVQRWVGAL
ncbi:MAG: DotU family type IV/VI secretion system protein [Desulfobacterales bacterium]|nr:DotU family type IV/VI secretion system protein [Desulfobacterales bacterium]